MVLTFDYRFLGASGGEPRRQIIPLRQIEDIRNAVTFLQLQPEVDPERLGLFGVSLGGANVRRPASKRGSRPRSVCAALATADAGFEMPATSGSGGLCCNAWRPTGRGASSAESWNTYRPMRLCPNRRVRPPLFGQILDQYPQWSREISLSSGLPMIAYRPESVVADIAPRAILWLHGDADERVSMEESQSMYAKAGEPKKSSSCPASATAIF